ncbi:hypothetical protein OHS81_11600 [Streptomyces sp. NBC_00400]
MPRFPATGPAVPRPGPQGRPRQQGAGHPRPLGGAPYGPNLVPTSVPSLRTDWEIRKGAADRPQKAYREAGVTRGAPLPENRLVDRSLYAEAVGHRIPG